MHSKTAFHLGVMVVPALGLACLSANADPDAWAVARPRIRPSDWGFGGAPSACDPNDEDTCTRCEKRACCDEIAACDDVCRAGYAAYHNCLYPGDGAWSGFGSAECRNRTVASSATGSALVDCFSSQCSTDSTCGVEPRAAFAVSSSAADFSAAEFVEHYCSGCHFPGFASPTGEPTAAFSADWSWTAPLANPDWFAWMSYELVVTKKDAIVCGVRDDVLLSSCTTLVRPAFFTQPGKFPPSGHGVYGGAPNPCRFASDGMTCPQPTPFERARLLSWFAAGSPR
jgi:hypothetical protein